MTSKSQTVLAIIGATAICVSFVAGSCLGWYVGRSLLGSIEVSWLARLDPAQIESPTIVQEPSPGPLEAETPSLAPATATTTWVVPPLLSTMVRSREPVSPDQWEPDDTPAEANPIEVGETQSHNLHVQGDRDWLYFEAEEGESYLIETLKLGREIDTVLSLYDSEGNELASDDDGGEEFLSSRLFWLAEKDEKLYVLIRGFSDSEGGYDTQYGVSLRLAERFRMDEYEPDDSPAQATRIEVGETQRHNWHVSGDEDWVSFWAEGGSTYVIETSRLGDRADTVIYLYDAQGNELALDDDSGDEPWASRLQWTVPDSGLFFVKVENWLPRAAGPGTGYDLTLRMVPEG